MSAPMAGFGPMAWSPFPYGPIPSSGVISPFYVDLFNDQPVAGKKSWIVAAAVGVEEVAVWGVSDAPNDSLKIVNRSGSASRFVPQIQSRYTATSTEAALTLMAEVTAVRDSGVVPMTVLDNRTDTLAALTARNLLSLRNNGTEVASVSAKGAWTYTVLHTDAAAETLATWALDEDTGTSLGIQNATTTNLTFHPMILGLGASSNRRPMVLAGRGGTDSGTVPMVVIDASIGTTRVGLGTGTGVTVRPCISFTNNGTEMAQFTAAGSFAVSNPITHRSYTVGTLPSAAIAGQEVYVSDAAVAPCLAFSNGTNWKRCDNAATTVV